ncbi:hypothetical protein Slin15195_G072970 [Septoria linicola]|uniref:Uncharacterized protein n=1 Tax=Septoria linicola TaxID=215465 RepID=A0A9Q9AVJ5_9PEZI|nr:hypothetical protein Slin14017_G105690 [Septoria linicola]USW53978.1 hypothetical protein Slin15195_G072970 [Septoria linicola]
MALTIAYCVSLLACFSLLLPSATGQTPVSTTSLPASDSAACNNFVGACVVYDSSDDTAVPYTTTVYTGSSQAPEATTTVTVSGPSSSGDAANACANFTGACVVYNGAETLTDSSHTATTTTTSSPGNREGYIAISKGGGDGYIGEGASTSIGLALISFVLVNVLFCVLL